ncbi:MAG: DUF3499 domain-containing protein [Tessaracoccus sp.]|nr:DUF3499 domain-containing protein [Tessaracoccus sp.]
MPLVRSCSRTACSAPAVATMTYAYTDRAAVLGPLSPAPEPGAYDLCPRHAERTSAPQGWQVLRLPFDGVPAPSEPATDDLMALADAVRAIGLRHDDPVPAPPDPSPTTRGGHLRLVTGG